MFKKEKLILTQSLKIRDELNKAMHAINKANKILEQRKDKKSEAIQLFNKKINQEMLEKEKGRVNEAIELINEEIKQSLKEEMKRVYGGQISSVEGYADLLDKMRLAIEVVGKNLIDLKRDLQIISFIQIIVKRIALKLIEEAKKADSRKVCNDLLDVIKMAIEVLAESSMVMKGSSY